MYVVNRSARCEPADDRDRRLISMRASALVTLGWPARNRWSRASFIAASLIIP